MANKIPKIENKEVDWNDLKYALAVSRHGGLSHAAKLLGTSASTVSRHIQQLETRLGQTLFLRQQSGYLLTDQGKEVLGLIANVEQALLALERHQNPEEKDRGVSGLIRLACSEMMASHMIVPNLPKLYQLHPDLQVELVEGLRLVNLNRREADLALRLVASGGKPGEQDYIVHLVGAMPFAAYVSKHHDVGNKHISWGQDLSNSPMVEWLSQRFKTESAVLYSNSGNVQLQAAKHGVGIAMLPRFVGDADPDLREIELSKTRLCREVWLVYHRDLKASNRIQVMRDFLKTSIQESLGG